MATLGSRGVYVQRTHLVTIPDGLPGNSPRVKYTRDVGTAPLTIEDVGGPPQRFRTAAESSLGTGNSVWSTVAETEIETGFRGVSVEFIAGLNEPSWAFAVEFALFIGADMFNGYIHRGIFREPLVVSNLDIKAKTKVAIGATVLREHWSNVAGGVKIRDYLEANAEMVVTQLIVDRRGRDD